MHAGPWILSTVRVQADLQGVHEHEVPCTVTVYYASTHETVSTWHVRPAAQPPG